MNPYESDGEAHTPQLASFWARFMAAFLDGLITFIVSLFIFTLLRVFFPYNPQEQSTFILLNVFGVLLNWIYYAGLESSVYQATLGKQMMGIFVTDEMGERMTLARATVRHFSKIISAIIFLIGYLMAAFTPQRQALHDMIARTLVYRY
ncbi:RDD family protein [Pontibacter silvestris]|uniref:RDD family protein n=1 Tax=Pontibacter silvestris TaxID=2305183 RepID=A0ABW4WR71_9BACT|nr:RDD family protein [Pontibacter silvestris]MCC9138586.1 RDD family protein [Pontibacter silvestris]